MQELISLKTFFWALLFVMLTVVISGIYENAHAKQNQMTVVGDQISHLEFAPSGQCPCCPFEQHKNSDGCDDCINCACHAPLRVQSFQLNYSPIVLNLNVSTPFQFLPKVYLPKFIPPNKRLKRRDESSLSCFRDKHTFHPRHA